MKASDIYVILTDGQHLSKRFYWAEDYGTLETTSKVGNKGSFHIKQSKTTYI